MFWRRWLFLVLGGALFTPYALLAMIALPLAVPWLVAAGSVTMAVLAATVITVALVVTSFLPIVGTLEAAVVPALLGGPAADLVVHPARSHPARVRTSAWYVLHTLVGAVVSVVSVAVPPIALSLLVTAVAGGPALTIGSWRLTVERVWAAPLAAVLLAGVVLLAWATGLLAAAWAPRLLGPDMPTRLAELERRTQELTERSRLARELHDSVGHALTVTTLQASAARTVLHTDPRFAERALLAIEQTGRVAAAELDGFLGMLREERAPRRPPPTLQDAPGLVRSHREAGLPVGLDVSGDVTTIPQLLSREAYRVVQEGLTNAQRHAGQVDTTVRVDVGPTALTVDVVNRRTGKEAGLPPAGGRGLLGVRERVRLLGGQCRAGPDGDRWVLHVSVPTGRGR